MFSCPLFRSMSIACHCSLWCRRWHTAIVLLVKVLNQINCSGHLLFVYFTLYIVLLATFSGAGAGIQGPVPGWEKRWERVSGLLDQIRRDRLEKKASEGGGEGEGERGEGSGCGGRGEGKRGERRGRRGGWGW